MNHRIAVIALPLASLLSGCPQPGPTPARDTTARPAPRRTPPRRAKPGPLLPHPRWEVKTGHQQAQLVAVQYGCLLVLAGDYVAHGSPARELRCHAPDTGAARWTFRGGAAPLSYRGAHSQVVFLQDLNGKHLFVDARTGKAVDRPKGALPKPAAGPLRWKGRRYAVSDATVRCTDETSGKPVWEAPASGPVAGLMRQYGVVYYAVGGERAIHARDARSGLGVWLHQIKPQPDVKHPRQVNFSFRVVGKRLYVARYDGSIAAFDIRPVGAAPASRAAPTPRGRSLVPAGVPREYTVCGCGCCGGGAGGVASRRKAVCLYWGKGQDIRKLIAQDRAARKNPRCATMGCALGTRYTYCD